jgi:hypothetical protein
LPPFNIGIRCHLSLTCHAPPCTVQYVLHFPKGEKYVSIIKDSTDPAAQATLAQERARLKTLVKQQLAESAMLADADEGLSLVAPSRTTKALPHPARAAREGAGGAESVESEEEDDFFMQSDDDGHTQPAAAMAVPAKEDSDGGNAGPGASEEETDDGDGEVSSSGGEEEEGKRAAHQVQNKRKAEHPAVRHQQQGRDGDRHRPRNEVGMQKTETARPFPGRPHHRPAPSQKPYAAGKREGGGKKQARGTDVAGRASGSKKSAAREAEEKVPQRARAEGGRKRRKRKE